MSNKTLRDWHGREEAISALLRGAKKWLGRGLPLARRLALPSLSALTPFVAMTLSLQYPGMAGANGMFLWFGLALGVVFMSFIPMDIEVRLGILFVYIVAEPLLLFWYAANYVCAWRGACM